LDKEEIIAIYNKPMMDLLYEAATSIENIKCGSGIHFIVYKTGGCPDCGYCPQAARYHTSVEGMI
jgi:biotin synthase